MEVHAESVLEKLSITSPASSNSQGPITILPILPALIDTTFSSTTNLSTSVLHAQILSFSDEYFAGAANLLTPTPAIRKAGYYVHTGAWFDGWETRRHNRKEYDWVVIKLGCVGVIEGIEVDTAHFNGNEAPAAGVDGLFAPDGKDEEIASEGYSGWDEVLPKQPCGPSMRQAWKIGGQGVQGRQWTHLKLKMYPDGGIARLRVYGSVVPPPISAAVAESKTEDGKPLEDLASALNGGVATVCSDQHFGVKSNLLLPGRGKDMGDGWETARSRRLGHVDWAVIKLGLKGRSIHKVVVDTKDFRGNFPRSVKVEGWKVDDAKAAFGTEGEPDPNGPGWVDVVKGEKDCGADKEHVFEAGDLADGLKLDGQLWTHIKMTIIPDGGVKRIRVFGTRV